MEPVDPKMDNFLNASVTIPFFSSQSVRYHPSCSAGRSPRSSAHPELRRAAFRFPQICRRPANFRASKLVSNSTRRRVSPILTHRYGPRSRRDPAIRLRNLLRPHCVCMPIPANRRLGLQCFPHPPSPVSVALERSATTKTRNPPAASPQNSRRLPPTFSSGSDAAQKESPAQVITSAKRSSRGPSPPHP
jgi:hypothetical protein